MKANKYGIDYYERMCRPAQIRLCWRGVCDDEVVGSENEKELERDKEREGKRREDKQVMLVLD